METIEAIARGGETMCAKANAVAAAIPITPTSPLCLSNEMLDDSDK